MTTYIKIKHILDSIYHYNTSPPQLHGNTNNDYWYNYLIKTNSCYPLNSWWPLIDAIMSFDLEVILNRRQETIGQWSKLVAENMPVIIRSKVERKLGYISEIFDTNRYSEGQLASRLVLLIILNRIFRLIILLWWSIFSINILNKFFNSCYMYCCM